MTYNIHENKKNDLFLHYISIAVIFGHFVFIIYIFITYKILFYVRYTYDVTKCMFSSGNITEKLRIAQFSCEGETIVDLYAGLCLFMYSFSLIFSLFYDYLTVFFILFFVNAIIF